MQHMYFSPRTGRYAAALWVSAFLAAPLTPAWAADDWAFSAGAVTGVAPRYPGSDQSRALVVPYVQARYKDFLVLNPIEGVGIEQAVSENLKLSASLGFDLTRRQAKDDSRLNGLVDVKEAAALRLIAKYRVGPVSTEVKLLSRLGNDQTRGTLLSAEGGYSVLATRDSGVDLGLALRWMDSSYSRSFCGVNAGQSASSGLKIFNASSGIESVGIFASGYQRLSPDWTGFARLGVNKLQGDAANSPITRSNTQTTWIAGVRYAF